MGQKKTVLVAPLNWGLGHATRLVPVVDELLRQQAKVILAADKRAYDFLEKRFPECHIIRLPGFDPVYPDKGSMAIKMIFSFREMKKQARKAFRKLQQIIEEHKIDIVISDNRYELHTTKAYCVFITHQLNIQTHGLQRLFKPWITRTVYQYISKYDELWIPDFKGLQQNLSGILSHVKKYPVANYHFIGPMSRFSIENMVKPEPFDLLVILSGPEPQRTILENLITEQANNNGLETVLLQGKPEKQKTFRKNNITFIAHAEDAEISRLIMSASLVVSRPGYSTLMDLSVFGKKAAFIPTPGQTEQLYLAKRLKKLGYCYYEDQDTFNLLRLIKVSEKYNGLPKIPHNHSIETVVWNILSGDH